VTALAPIVPAVPTVPSASRERLCASLEAEALRQAARFPLAEQRPRVASDTNTDDTDDTDDTAPDPFRAGIDLVPVADVASSVERLGRRYLYRVFTPHERACARIDAVRGIDRDRAGYSMESLAARFAAKEAAVKVLRPVGTRPEWRSIEVRRTGGGWCELRLTGLAASLAAEAGITTLAVSVTHEPMMAAACVVGTIRGDDPAWCRTPPPDWRGN